MNNKEEATALPPILLDQQFKINIKNTIGRVNLHS